MAIIRGRPGLSETNPKQFLIEHRFPTLKALRANSVNVDGFNFSKTQKIRQNIEKDAAKYQAELDELTYVEILSKVKEAKAEIAKKNQQAAEEREKNQYFNKPSALADFQYWAKMSFWSLEECTVLSFGRSPDIVKISNVESQRQYSPFVKELLDTHRLVKRATSMNQLAKSNIPGFFVAWAKRNNISIPQELADAVVAHGHQIADWKTGYEESVKHLQELQSLSDKQNKQIEMLLQKINEMKANQQTKRSVSKANLHPRTRDNLLRLIIVMAVDGYSYDPKAAKSPTHKDLEGFADQLGISLSDDTIRKYLKQAAELLPGDKTEKDEH